MKTRQIGLLGFGALGSSIARKLVTDCPDGLSLGTICVRPQQRNAARAACPGTRIVTTIDNLLSATPAIVIETAGQAAVEDYAETILERGCDLCVVSVGALANSELRRHLAFAARRGRSHLQIPSGALAGFDGLLALARQGLNEVHYVSTKPPQAWKGTPAEDTCDLDRITRPTTVFKGNAAEAACLFPRNANLAAAIALAGLGFEATSIELVADPHAIGNHAHIEAYGSGTNLQIDLTGQATPENPKSSAIVAASVLAALHNRQSAIQFI